ncbi:MULTISPECIES: ABC transporter ATP-binding protein [Pseudomonas]|uniref:ABC transporter ATP-binding protein n=2 Tax=Pseudomonas TaxID=286 RepID=A0A4Y9TE02_PSEFL|nr:MULTISPECIES: ABC transporter ATP-binding protein [Pseudomonas]MCX9151257.1 ABC transporter ATP-binding protein [Pseudomonas sp. TB1-B1]QXH69044.1 ABC transporter ATP-binding protein [Pseudomonas asgharzadehiana]TFW41610.1 ABC transporter ATP-binding protein [Pseudomonas fluorescens]CRM97646.1 putative ABC transporter ATP-binding protein YbhF [Pseudomonas sp. 22 E 5]
MIEISNLTKYLNKKNRLSDISFNAKPRECLGLFGDDPIAKTTLLNLMSASIFPSSGNINIQGLDTRTQTREVKRLVGYQLYRHVSHATLTVKEFLYYIAATYGFKGAEQRARVEQAATRLELLTALNAPLDALSIGLKRKVGIAQAILHTPLVLLMDEPTEGLAPDQKHAFTGLIQSLKQDMTLVIASRNPDELSQFCTRALVIADGRLVTDAPLQKLQRDSRHFQAVTLTADTPLDLLALAVLPGVAGIEEHQHAPGTVTVLAMPGHTIYTHIHTLIANRGWKINTLDLEPGRVNEVVPYPSQERRL